MVLCFLGLHFKHELKVVNLVRVSKNLATLISFSKIIWILS